VRPTVDGPDEESRPLSEAGLRQADALVAVLIESSPGRVLSSPYLRAVQTVAPTAEALNVRVEKLDALREWDSGLEPTPAWERHYREAWERPERAINGGESHLVLEQRAVHALRELAADVRDEADVVVASHGTWIARALHGLGCPVDVTFWLSMPMPAVFVVQTDGERLDATCRSLTL